MLSQLEFRKLSLNKRHVLLQEKGDYIGARENGSHRVYLFSYNHYFVEVWALITLNQIQWIEVQENQQIINLYTDQLNLDDLFL